MGTGIMEHCQLHYMVQQRNFDMDHGPGKQRSGANIKFLLAYVYLYTDIHKNSDLHVVADIHKNPYIYLHIYSNPDAYIIAATYADEHAACNKNIYFDSHFYVHIHYDTYIHIHA